MPINYKPVGWDTTKYVNPTNMNQMDDGIKAACDGVDVLTKKVADANENVQSSITELNDMVMDLKETTELTIGSQDISDIADGTLTGAVNELSEILNFMQANGQFEIVHYAESKTLVIRYYPIKDKNYPCYSVDFIQSLIEYRYWDESGVLQFDKRLNWS